METKIIAEIKKGSPLGIIQENIDPIFYAHEYTRLGAKAISVVTADSYFGDKSWIKAVKDNSKLPVLRKDFITTVDQLKETKDLGADWVLLIASNLTSTALIDLVFYAGQIGLKPIVEIARIIDIISFTASGGNTVVINNRSLISQKIDLNISRMMVSTIPDNYEVVVASGIDTNISYMKELREFDNVDWVLIGTLFMKSNNLEETFKILNEQN